MPLDGEQRQRKRQKSMGFTPALNSNQIPESRGATDSEHMLIKLEDRRREQALRINDSLNDEMIRTNNLWNLYDYSEVGSYNRDLYPPKFKVCSKFLLLSHAGRSEEGPKSTFNLEKQEKLNRKGTPGAADQLPHWWSRRLGRFESMK